MCGIAGIAGGPWLEQDLIAMKRAQDHRGPDDHGHYISRNGDLGIAHNRLSILDLSEKGHQPFCDPTGRYQLVFNGEIYNYKELRQTLSGHYQFHSDGDTEVLLAGWLTWGEQCLEKLNGMFAFAIWDEVDQTLVVVRDRFGVKPLYYHVGADGSFRFASEIKALHASGVPKHRDEIAWAGYLVHGCYDHSLRTFWEGVRQCPPGFLIRWKPGEIHFQDWYDLAERVGEQVDDRSLDQVMEEYFALLQESVRFRFRSDVPVGINLSGGLDSSLLLGTVQTMARDHRQTKAFTFVTGDERYDELPWVRQMLDRTQHVSVACHLAAEDVPDLAESVSQAQDEPFGGLPTLAYARLFEIAREEGVTVLLDGQGMDEQWAGYDYYQKAEQAAETLIQGTRSRPLRPECLNPDFRALAEPMRIPQKFEDPLRQLQYRDLRYTKIPRALRFNDRISMRVARELREPFLDYRLVELALKQPGDRKIREGQGKWFLRQLAKKTVPDQLVEAPKRALQTPQREWLSGPLQDWAGQRLDHALDAFPHWFDTAATKKAWQRFVDGDNLHSFFVWQWISLSYC